MKRLISSLILTSGLFSLSSLLIQASPADDRKGVQASTADDRKGAQAVTPPNIIYINIDDLGWADLGYNGSTFYETPNIDRFASQSMNFTNGYAPAANCAPSRACCLTGQWTPRHGVYTVNNSDRGKASTRKLIPTKNTLHISNDNPTIGDALKAGGYHTATMGKWHVTKDPLKNGFDINIGGTQAGGPYNGGYHSPFKYPNLEEKEPGVYLTDRLTDEAIRYVSDTSKRPFFLYLPYFAIHTPIQGKKEKIEHFKKKIKPGSGQKNPEYAAMISSLDDNIGRLMKTLDEQGLSDNTLVIFTSDNGGVYKLSQQKPLRAGKGAYYEGGIREPFLIRWPAKVKAGKNPTPVVGIDFFPTLLDAAKVKPPKGKVLDGLSLLPELTGSGKLASRALYWHFPIYLQGGNSDCQDGIFRTRPGSAIRHGDWKLIEYFENGDLELYNLAKDEGEQKNLASSHPEKTQELLGMLKSWRKQTKAPVPSQLNPKFKP
ncbi:sulfatase [Verrucomicrobiaceae bacterium N1E253]|uniref:Sulfatase n=1 Tax=Oceaniferula marina TaxID=2748318 RepID=A0A851GIT8_9BACT|nr:sulfatase [Oceaniferula marina]NWK55037.1 sulfatase [Oceaniferula marina]